jgi:hypothetical protein
VKLHHWSAVALCFASVGVCAAPPIAAGDGQVGFAGQVAHFDADDGASITLASLFGSYGYFLTARNEVGLIADLFWADGGFYDNEIDGALGAYYNYNFVGETPLVPYLGVGASADVGTGASPSDTAVYEGHAGVHYFVNPAVALKAEAYYVDNVRDYILDNYGVRFGFSWFLH